MHSMLGTKHLILLAISAVFTVVGVLFTRKWELKKFNKVILYIGIVSEIIKVFYYTLSNEGELHGILPKTDLPFHLCSIQIIFILILNLVKNEKIHRFLYSFMLPSCMLGGFAAIMIPTHTALNGQLILSAQYFGYHACIVIFAIHLACSSEFKITLQDYVNCLKLLLGIIFFAIYINSALYDGVNDINFMYTASPPVSGLPYLNENHGWLVYICHYGFLVIFCITIAYIKPILRALFKKKETVA